MGQEFCNGCRDNCLSTLEGNLSNRQFNNKPEQNFLFRQSDNIDDRTNPSILFTQNKIRDNMKYTEIYDDNNIYSNNKAYNPPCVMNNSIDKRKLYEIIFKYKIQLLIKYFRKFKILKYKKLKKIIVENYYMNPFELPEKNNKYNQEPDVDLSPKNNYIFIGHKFNDKKEGYGLEIYLEINARYFGGFKYGKKNGLCKFSINNKEKSYYYFGEVINNRIEGFGYCNNSKNGTKYEGEWKNSLRNGYGIEYYEDGSFYQGQFSNGTKTGIGLYKWLDRSSYEGEWLNNCLHGYGKYTFSDNSIYIGNWNYNKMDGFGIFSYPSQKKYLGFFKNNLKDGFGMIFSQENRKAFIGFWNKNRQNGLGQFINNHKCIYGIWENGKLSNKIGSEDVFFNSFSDFDKIYKNNFTTNNFDDFNNKIVSLLSFKP